MSTFLYNPDRKGKSLLLSEFVVRTRVYDNIIHDIESSKMEHPEQHYLLVGQRGAGKTTLLNRIKYGIEDSPQLSPWLIPILFTEEQYNISELANLWESIAQYLEDYYGFRGLTEEIEEHLYKSNFEEIAFDLLEEYLTRHQKKLVLLIDNIGDLLKKLDRTEVHRLREILQTKKEIRLIAGSPFYLESILDYQQPLFEFFKVIRLEGLNQRETEKLLLRLGEIYDKRQEIEKIIRETPERVITLRTLTGGVPRTIALMFNIFIDYNNEGSVKDLERILDAVTPLYKHRMDDLPVQQQKIVDAVAKSWDAISVKELKEKTRIESKIISAQLRQLEKNQIIEKKETGTKNHLYFLRERFFNIWYLMRYGRKDDQQRVIWLVRFLESWCSSNDLESRVLDYIEKIKSGKLDDNTKDLFGHIYAAISNLNVDVKLLLKKSVPKNISNSISIPETEVYNLMNKHYKSEEYEEVLQIALDTYYSTERIKHLILVAASIQYIAKGEIIGNIIKKVLASEKEELSENYIVQLTEVEAEIFKGMIFSRILARIYFNEIDKIFSEIEQYFMLLNKKDFVENSFEYKNLNKIFVILLAHRHFNLLLKIFESISDFNLKGMFKPVYFALLLLKEGKNSSEYLKAGPELHEIVNKVIDDVNIYRIDQKELIEGLHINLAE